MILRFKHTPASAYSFRFWQGLEHPSLIAAKNWWWRVDLRFIWCSGSVPTASIPEDSISERNYEYEKLQGKKKGSNRSKSVLLVGPERVVYYH